MDVLNRISAGIGTLKQVSKQVSNALPGNVITREFALEKQIGSAGIGFCWKIYSAVQSSTKQEASVFVLEKKSLDHFEKHDREILLDLLKKGVSQLTRLRHPRILSVMHPLEESRDSLAFATEPLFCGLSNVLGCHNNISNVSPELKEYSLYDVEIRYGLLQMSEGLAFLHNDAKLIHRNVCPQSIVVCKNGSWKLFGFEFALNNCSSPEESPSYPFIEWTDRKAAILQPNLDYLAPEYALTARCGSASDMYSFGITIYSIFNRGKPLFECGDSWNTFSRNVEQLRTMSSTLLGSLPDNFRSHVKLLLNVEASIRPDADQFVKIPFFEDVNVMSLQYLDSLYQRDNLQRSQFFKGFPQVLVKFPKRVSLHRVLPHLLEQCSNAHMIPFIIPNILVITEETTTKEFQTLILPHLIPLFRIRDPIQILLVFMQNMSLLIEKTPPDDIRNHILPMVYQALDSKSPEIQYNSIKNGIVPKIKNLCLITSMLSIRVNCLICIGKLLELMDKWYVTDDILPFLSTIPSREPAVLMSILGIYKVTMTHAKLGLTKEILATKVLPFLLPLSIDNNLNYSQYNQFSTLIHEMLSQVETEHKEKLKQLSKMKDEQKSLNFQSHPIPKKDELIPGIANIKDTNTTMDSILSDFGFSNINGDMSGGDAVKTDGVSASSQSHSSSPLSLEAKQRLAEQQEIQMKAKSTSSMKTGHSKTTSSLKYTTGTYWMSSGSAAKSTPTAPKDLTSSLIDNNLKFLSASSSSSKNNMNTLLPNYSPFGTNTCSTPMTSSSYGSSISQSAFSHSTVIPNTTTIADASFFPQPSTAFNSATHSTGFSTFSSPLFISSGSHTPRSIGHQMTSSSSTFSTNVHQISSTTNLSPFDDIVTVGAKPGPASKQRLPMNQMQKQQKSTVEEAFQQHNSNFITAGQPTPIPVFGNSTGAFGDNGQMNSTMNLMNKSSSILSNKAQLTSNNIDSLLG